MLGCRSHSMNLGDSMHIEQSLVGKVLSSCAILPPMVGRLLHQVDLEAGGGQVERGLDAADAAADDHHVAAQVVVRAQGTLAHRFVGVIEGVFQCVCHVMTP